MDDGALRYILSQRMKNMYFYPLQMSPSAKRRKRRCAIQNRNIARLPKTPCRALPFIREQKIVYANPAMCQINGYTVEELMAMSADEIIALTHPDDRAMAQERVPQT